MVKKNYSATGGHNHGSWGGWGECYELSSRSVYTSSEMKNYNQMFNIIKLSLQWKIFVEPNEIL